MRPRRPLVARKDSNAGYCARSCVSAKSVAKAPPKAEPELIEQIASGGFGTVWRARLATQPDKVVAVKVIDLKEGSVEQTRRAALQEIKNHAAVSRGSECAAVIRLISHLETQSSIELVMEYCPGKEWAEFVPEEGLDESMAAYICKQLVAAVEACHACGVAHLDLRAENVLVQVDASVRLIDFGSSVAFEGHELSEAYVELIGGTVGWMSPERVELEARFEAHDFDSDDFELAQFRFVGPAADVYTVGQLAYHALYGYSPFEDALEADESPQAILEAMREGPVFEDEDELSVHAVSFVRALMAYEANERPTARQCANLPWMGTCTSVQGHPTNKHQLTAPVAQEVVVVAETIVSDQTSIAASRTTTTSASATEVEDLFSSLAALNI